MSRILPLAPPRAALSLPEGAAVLCCFEPIEAITTPMIDLWGQILRAASDAVLWLKGSKPAAQARLLAEFEARGVPSSRFVFAPRVGDDQNIARLQCADICLDIWPHNTPTLIREALWAGVPVLTVTGASFLSRAADETQARFVCADAQSYVDSAVALTHDLDALHAAQLRLREHGAHDESSLA